MKSEYSIASTALDEVTMRVTAETTVGQWRKVRDQLAEMNRQSWNPEAAKLVDAIQNALDYFAQHERQVFKNDVLLRERETST